MPAPHQGPKSRILLARKKVPIISGYKNQWGLSQWKKLLESQAVHLNKVASRLTQTHSLWAPAWGKQLKRHQWHTGRNWRVWHQGTSSGTAFSQKERQTEAVVPSFSPHPTESQSQQADAISETPSTWLTLFAQTWRFPETPSHPTCIPPNLPTHPSCWQRLFHRNGWSWLMLHNFLNPLKQATANLSEPAAPVPLAKWPQAWH